MNRGLGMAPRWRPWDRRWEARYLDETGAECSVTARVKGDTGDPKRDKGHRLVEQRKRDALDRLARHLDPQPETMTVAQWADRWLATWVDADADLAPRSKRTYRYVLEHYVLPELGGRRLSGLTPSDITGWQGALAVPRTDATGKVVRKALGTTTWRGAMVLVRDMLNRAVGDRLLDANPAAKDVVKTPEAAEPEFAVWSPADAGYFLDALDPDDWFRPAAVLGIMCGLRNGEMCGLAWSDLDLDTDPAVGHFRWQSDPETQERVPVKRDSVGDLTLARIVMAELVAWRRRQVLQGRAGTDGRVLTTRDGGPMRRRYLGDALCVRIRQVNAKRSAEGLPPLIHQWPHALRHQAGTFQFMAGAREAEVGKYLRHRPGSKVTLRYMHLGQQFQDAAAARVDSLFPVETATANDV